jgi:hypothetical protein
MSGSVFPLSLITQVTLVPPALVPGVPNQSTICIVTQDAKPGGWVSTQQFALYDSSGLAQIGTDFGVDSNTYAIANGIYTQSPSIFAVPDAYVMVLPRLQSPSLEALPAAVARGLALQYFYGVVIDQELAQSDPTSFAQFATYIETSGCLFFYASSNANDLNPGSPLDLVRQAGESHTRCLYYGQTGVLLNGAAAQQTQIFASSYAARLLSVNFLASNSTLTMAYKTLNGIPADGSLTESQLTAAQAAGVDIYPNISSVIGCYISGSNQFSDMVYNDDWLSLAIQIAGVDEIVRQANKLALTEAGVTEMKNAMKVVLNQAVANGYAAPGAWPAGAATFGDQASFLRNIAQTGFYIYSTPVAQLTQAQLATRQAPPIQIAILAAGAIQSCAVIINVALG